MIQYYKQRFIEDILAQSVSQWQKLENDLGSVSQLQIVHESVPCMCVSHVSPGFGTGQ